MKYSELIENVRNWADEKGITKKGTVAGQVLKTCEEMAELETAIYKDNIPEMIDAVGDVFVTVIIGDLISEKNKKFDFDKLFEIGNYNKFKKIQLIHSIIYKKYIFTTTEKDNYSNENISNILHTLQMVCDSYDLDILECLESAYNVISNRKGKMINGVFVKEV